jgi:hypothetical protein
MPKLTKKQIKNRIKALDSLGDGRIGGFLWGLAGRAEGDFGQVLRDLDCSRATVAIAAKDPVYGPKLRELLEQFMTEAWPA